MKNKFGIRLLTAILVIMVTVLPYLVMAQPNPDCPDPDVPCPIDGGLSLLLAAGVGYGVKKYRDSRKQQGENESKVN